MSKQEQSEKSEGRPELPIERGFPIERVNEIAEKESRAKQYYRPIYTMHKWWARRPGCLFRAITLYSLLNESTTADDVEVYEPGENKQLGNNGLSKDDLVQAINDVDMDDPESLWDFYPKDIRIKDKKILDPFMGGGTSLVEASRFGVESVGVDLNPVAWFVTKKQLDAGQTDVEDVKVAFEQVKEDVADEITQYYKTPCPNGDHNADVMYNFWVKELDCVSCGHTVPLFKDYRVAAGRYENDDKYNVLCPDCGEVILVDNWQEENTCSECSSTFTPSNGNVTRGNNYSCPECGQKYGIPDAIQEQNGDTERLYAVEYYCEHCDDRGETKSVVKGYKSVEAADIENYESAAKEWETNSDIHRFVPSEPIRPGWYTASTQYDGSAPGAHDVHKYGYTHWTDMFTDRQQLSIAKLLRSISKIDDENVQEFLLLALSGSLRYTNRMVGYHHTRNHIHDIFKTNSFDPPTKPAEANVWGTEYGLGNFRSSVQSIINGIQYANAPTERYVDGNDSKETEPFSQPVGQNSDVFQGDMRRLDAEEEYDVVITDPPYYHNILYSELSDYYYVWQRVLLGDRYECFEDPAAPRDESIVVNPATNKGSEEFETELTEAFSVVRTALKSDGVLSFTYHHSDSESWGELLESLCNTGFEVTATYPINSDLNKFIEGGAVDFDIVIVARPTENRQPISWDSLRRRIVRTARETRETLEENRELAGGDIGVIEMGRCFQGHCLV
ncbi:adenine-specific DNA modification methylase [Natronomonas moolapensis 8.8.11]|uniref:Adenine-specific DNA modification methylase n=1 Tax=Natronomonas moolapensis (strain DSM 18674 / CECT 7526 / JCM 14361 / 8.8.11) TaxID=268739 RepID=M1Y2L8_NATM8|nr:DUF1156 domain-containing protein [Natronomonas moolapensis]CCQ36748.1 adenine-specific DNA modification methylase [Natronomonas moolapensis 8.8.11]